MKVELENLHLSASPATDEVFVGITQKNNPNVWKYKKNVTNDFLSAVIQRWNGFKQVIESESGERYEISVKKIN